VVLRWAVPLRARDGVRSGGNLLDVKQLGYHARES